uniref:Uncharacterized protein n=1 Tax=Octopus bimaculoides TaxID=37653 RepID=A0A0L8G7I0_OCTBM
MMSLFVIVCCFFFSFVSKLRLFFSDFSFRIILFSLCFFFSTSFQWNFFLPFFFSPLNPKSFLTRLE